MPYVYVGKRNFFIGKTLWEIVGNLKNFGVGRMLVRSKFERYPEVTYYRIVKAHPLMDEVDSIEFDSNYTVINYTPTCRKICLAECGSRRFSEGNLLRESLS